MNTIKIKPGLLVSLSVRTRGGVSYEKKSISESVEDKTEIAAWETKRITMDVEEHDRATKVRGSIRFMVSKVCSHSSFGLLCPETKEQDLDAAVSEAKALARAFNEDAQHTVVDVFVLKGRVASTDQEAAEAITQELRILLGDMERACKAADPAAIREAATKAKGLGEVLEGRGADAVSEAVRAARIVARAVVKRVQKEGESAESVLSELDMAPIEMARFLLDGGIEEVADGGDQLPAVEAQRFTGLELPIDEDPIFLDMLREAGIPLPDEDEPTVDSGNEVLKMHAAIDSFDIG